MAPRRVGPLAYRPAHERRHGRQRSPPSSGSRPRRVALEGAAPAGPSLSPSRAADFMTCPLLYRFRVVDRIPEAPSPAATRGTVVHAVLERLFDLPAAERTLDARARHGRAAVGGAAGGRAGAGPAPGGRRQLDGEPRRRPTAQPAGLPAFLADAGDLLEHVLRAGGPDAGSSRPSASCTSRSSSESGLRCAASSTGSTSSPRRRHARRRLQDRPRALARVRGQGDVPDALLRARAVEAVRASCRGCCSCCTSAAARCCATSPTRPTCARPRSRCRRCGAAIERATETGDWRPSPSRLCDWCDHQATRCPAWGGTPAAAARAATAAARAGQGGTGTPRVVGSWVRRAAAAARAVDLTKVYGEGDTRVRRAGRSVASTSARARITAIMGPSGSGKSTLMHCLAGLDTATSGQVFVGDTDLTALGDRELTQLRRDRVGFVFQSFNLLPTLTALENITLPLDIAGRKPGPGVAGHASSTPSACATGSGTGRPSCPAASSSGWPAPGRWRRGRTSSSPTSRPATSTRASGAEVLGFLRCVGARPRADGRDGHPRPDGRLVRRPGACSSPTAASSTRCPTRPPTRVLDRMKRAGRRRPGGLSRAARDPARPARRTRSGCC